MQPDIICLGEPLLEFSQIRSAEGRAHYLEGYGGDTANTAVAAARQGASVGYLTALGADVFGDDFLRLWAAEGVDASQVRRNPKGHTGIYFISYAATGHSFTYFRAGSAASLLEPADIPEDYLAGAKLLHVSGISQAISNSACDAVFAAIDIAKRHGVQVSYDTNLRLRLWSLGRARAVIHAALARADIALPSLEDAVQLTELTDPDAIADFYLNLNVPLVVLKLGAEGTLVATPTERRQIAAHRVTVVDATGAGDTFAGGFLASLLATGDPFTAAEYANAAAALSTQGYGAVAPIPRRAAVEAFLREQIPAGRG